MVQGGHAVVVEPRRDRPVDGEGLEAVRGGAAEPGELAADLSQGVLGASPLELVDGHGVGHVEHLDLLELGGRPVLGRHHVQRDVGQLLDARVALPDAGRLDDDEVRAPRRARRDHVGEVRGQPARGAAGAEGAEEDLARVDRVHPDAVAEQRAAAASPGRVDRHDADAELVLEVEAEPPEQLVGERALPRPPGPGHAEDGHLARGRRASQRLEDRPVEGILLDRGDRPREREPVATDEGVDRRERGPLGAAGELHHLLRHPGEPEPRAVLGGEDLRDPPCLELGDLLRDDHPAAAAEHLDPGPAPAGELVDQVGEVLHVAALVRAQGDAVDVLVDGRLDDLCDRAVVPEVHDLAPLALEEPSDQVDRRVVAVEQRGRRDEPDRGRAHDPRLRPARPPPGLRASATGRSPSCGRPRSGARRTWRS